MKKNSTANNNTANNKSNINNNLQFLSFSLEFQFSRRENLEKQASNIMTFLGTILAVSFGVFTVAIDSGYTISMRVYFLIIISIVSSICSVVISFFIFHSDKGYVMYPNLKNYFEYKGNKLVFDNEKDKIPKQRSDADFKKDLLGDDINWTLINVIAVNQEANRKKKKHLEGALISFFITILGVFMAISLLILENQKI